MEHSGPHQGKQGSNEGSLPWVGVVVEVVLAGKLLSVVGLDGGTVGEAGEEEGALEGGGAEARLAGEEVGDVAEPGNEACRESR